MIVNQVLTEIDRLTAKQWSGEDTMSPIEGALKRLPGGSGLLYTVVPRQDNIEISIITTEHAGEFVEPSKFSHHNKHQHAARVDAMQKQHQSGRHKIGQLVIYSRDDLVNVLKKPYSVDTVVTDPAYRGMGLSKALYGIVLSVLKYTLVAGLNQTPGGRLNWVSLVKIPGVTVKGLVELGEGDMDEQHVADAIMKLGGQYVGKHTVYKDPSYFWAFDVQPGSGELAPAVKSKLSRIYDNWDHATTMFATYNQP